MSSVVRASESDSSGIPDSSPAGLLELDDSGRILAINAVAANLLGCDPGVVIGLPLLESVDVASRDAVRVHLQEARDSRHIRRSEITATDPDGRLRHVLLQTISRIDEHETTTFQVALTDVTDYVQRLEAAEVTRSSAVDLSRSSTDFLAGLSHEIRSALASMIGFAEILRANATEENQDLADIITDSGRHLLDTLNSLIDLARPDFRKEDVEVAEIDVVKRVRERTALFHPFAEMQGLQLIFRAESETAIAELNVTFLDRIVYNLIDNAIKYTPSGKVEVSVEERNDQIWIYVADTGIGIDDQFVPKLFTPFERERRTAGVSAEGIGVGLSITKHLTEVMGGRIVMCSTKGEGSTFTVSFPALERPRTEGEV